MQIDNNVKSWVTLVTGVLSSLLLFLGAINVKYDWFTAESISAFGVLIGAILVFVLNLYAVWKNTYITKKGKKQLDVLEKNDLK